MQEKAIKRALVSVTDKSGVVDFCRALQEEFGVELISTGGTFAVLAEAGLEVKPIDSVTGFPEMMDGRVKTLHPRVHGGLLALRNKPEHMAQAAEHGIEMIDMVVVNLYEFEKAVASELPEPEIIEQIDIGGPSMIRSASKNFASVAVVVDPALYGSVLEGLREGEGDLSFDFRRSLALKAFQTTARYDAAIAQYLEGGESASTTLRYGENPHQSAEFVKNANAPEYSLARARQIQGKELSYNNLLDTDGAWSAVREFDEMCCVIVKHTNPCGVATSELSIKDAYLRAHESDPISAFGGIMAFNHTVTAELVEAVYENKQFVEVMIAPAYEEAALELLKARPNMRVLETGGCRKNGLEKSFRSIEGGMLVQNEDAVSEDPADFKVVSKRVPTEEELEQMLFAWKVAKSVKSNAIVLANDFATVGVGAGQMNRVQSAQIAVNMAGPKTLGSVCASDAFLPFTDTMELIAEAGTVALIQPGGSIRDEEVIARADELGIAMVFTGVRHFRH